MMAIARRLLDVLAERDLPLLAHIPRCDLAILPRQSWHKVTSSAF
jgi:hypothetical protein